MFAEETDTYFEVFSTKPERDFPLPTLAKKRGISSLAESGHNKVKQRRDLPFDSEISQRVILQDEFFKDQECQVNFAPPLNFQVEVDPREKLTLSHKAYHKVATIVDQPYQPLEKYEFTHAPKFGFKLDPFQDLACRCVERNESVLVSAHTSAGKTVIAEYAIEHGIRQQQRVIYTSPIKALSNQKYNDFREKNTDVGLLTGDVVHNESAHCLVMTTEILRSMIYQSPASLSEVGWVIFDEVHYMQHRERGLVWEESIILLPSHIRCVFLSATIPNAAEFIQWVCKIRQQPCHLIHIDYRPTPLQYYVYPSGGDGIHMVMDENRQFKEDSFERALACVDNVLEPAVPPKAKPGKKGKTPADIQKLLGMIISKKQYPAITFAFNRREVEACAYALNDYNLLTEDEVEKVEKIFYSGIDSGLRACDQTLSQVERMLPLLRQGIGFHHSGLLPILRELIEILFQEGLIKLLFATETFSIGLNMPAKTVIFSSIRKYDGVSNRWLTPGEFIQMSGRAGRRGVDDRGVVIMLLDTKIPPEAAREMLEGEAPPLNSAFHLTYTTILNLMRSNTIQPESILEQSFYWFQNSIRQPELTKELQKLSQEYESTQLTEPHNIAQYFEVRQKLDQYAGDLRKIMYHPVYVKKFIQKGRLVRVEYKGRALGWGCLTRALGYPQAKGKSSKEQIVDPYDFKRSSLYIVEVLIYCAAGTVITLDPNFCATHVEPCPPGENGVMIPVSLPLSALIEVSSLRIFLPKELDSKPAQGRNTVYTYLKNLESRFPDGFPLLDPVGDLNVPEQDIVHLVKKIEELENVLYSNALVNDPRLPELYNSYAHSKLLQRKIREVKNELKRAQSVIELKLMKSRKQVLQRLDYIKDDCVSPKGQAACAIQSGHELVLTEMIYSATFQQLEPEQIAALCSCFIFTSQPIEPPKLRKELADALGKLKLCARVVIEASEKAHLTVEESEYRYAEYDGYMDIVYEWCKGATLAEIMAKPDRGFEGDIIRGLRRLLELMQELSTVAKVIGNHPLEEKFEKASALIQRDIVSAASLYIE
ncbi:antiviral helicase [Basidiobolus meristosporus CBS 931.73]|uniref:Antiviral helicase n=1 Tax=Basidiobolus meristosporus CBS 931.73 TaxID=1314790 RepID=A0A1Y1Z139_9FUNG|nr:antiviral helicase [Basidiobolus meristosporus CBS 931.73]|eukprot:ORY03535.1 antiviral helicase [Basidiobolus meristosporus CBS 931.73]